MHTPTGVSESKTSLCTKKPQVTSEESNFKYQDKESFFIAVASRARLFGGKQLEIATNVAHKPGNDGCGVL